MNFICFKDPTTSHAPYPGVRVTADSQAEALPLAMQQLGISGTQKFFVVPEEAFTANCFGVGPISVTAPPYA